MESKGQVAPWSSRIRHELRAFAGGHFGLLPFAHFRQTPSQLQPGLTIGWRNLQDIKKAGYEIGLTYSAVDYGVSRLDLKFLNPGTREKELSELVIGEISRQ